MTIPNWMALGMLAVMVIIGVMQTASYFMLRERRFVWRETMNLLTLVKAYLETSQRVHDDAMREIKPAAMAAAENTEETKVIVREAVVPTSEQVKMAVLGEIKPTIDGLNEYTHGSNQEERGYWQSMFLRQELIARKIGVELPPVNVKTGTENRP